MASVFVEFFKGKLLFERFFFLCSTHKQNPLRVSLNSSVAFNPKNCLRQQVCILHITQELFTELLCIVHYLLTMHFQVSRHTITAHLQDLKMWQMLLSDWSLPIRCSRLRLRLLHIVCSLEPSSTFLQHSRAECRRLQWLQNRNFHRHHLAL